MSHSREGEMGDNKSELGRREKGEYGHLFLLLQLLFLLAVAGTNIGKSQLPSFYQLPVFLQMVMSFE